MKTDTLDPKITKPIKLTTLEYYGANDPRSQYTVVTPSNEARLRRKAEQIKKDKQKTFIIYGAMVSPPIDEETGDYFFEEEIGLKTGMTGQTFEKRWEHHGYEFTTFSTFTFPLGRTTEEVVKVEKAMQKEARDAGHEPHIFKLNTMGKCTETFHFDALLFIHKQFAILNKMTWEEIEKKYEL